MLWGGEEVVGFENESENESGAWNLKARVLSDLLSCVDIVSYHILSGWLNWSSHLQLILDVSP